MARKWILLGLVSLSVLPSCMSTQSPSAASLDLRPVDAVASNRPISGGASDSTGRYMIGKNTQLTMQDTSIQGVQEASALPVR